MPVLWLWAVRGPYLFAQIVWTNQNTQNVKNECFFNIDYKYKKKRSFLTSCCVFWFVFLNASSHLCFQIVWSKSKKRLGFEPVCFPGASFNYDSPQRRARLSDKTLCLSTVQGEHGQYRHYDVHNLYGWTQTPPTLQSVCSLFFSSFFSLFLNANPSAGVGRLYFKMSVPKVINSSCLFEISMPVVF